MSGNKTLTGKQTKCLLLLLSGETVTEASRALRISRDTIYRWMRQDRFREALTDARRDCEAVILPRLAGLLSKSLDVLGAGLDSKSERVRIQSALGVLGRYASILEMLDLSSRVESLERAQGANLMRKLELGGWDGETV